MNGKNNRGPAGGGTSMDKMLLNASKMLGTSPEKLKSAIEKGAVDDIISHMKPDDAQKLKSALKNKDVVEKLMKSPQAVELMKQMGNKK